MTQAASNPRMVNELYTQLRLGATTPNDTSGVTPVKSGPRQLDEERRSGDLPFHAGRGGPCSQASQVKRCFVY